MRGLCYFFLSILTQVHCSSVEVIGLIGHNVTLPCRYDTQTHGVQGFCWGRGKVPLLKCSNTILSSSDGAVLSLRDPRYQLLGRVTDGEVSLTILNAQWSDAGVYGCRVEIPGLFNDYEVNTYLVMKEEMFTRTEVYGLNSITIVTAEEKFTAFLEVGTIIRMAAIFFFAIIIIPVFIYRRRLLQRETLQHLNPSAAENIYEIDQTPE